jgi:outer membrane protein TolC
MVGFGVLTDRGARRARVRRLVRSLVLVTGLTGGLVALAAAADPVLDSLVTEALKSSPVMARARAAGVGAQARVSLAKSAYRPAVGLSEAFTRTEDPRTAFGLVLEQGRFTPALLETIDTPRAVDDWATNLYVQALLTDFGRRRANVAAALEDATRLRLLEQAAARDVRFSVAATYYGLIRARTAVTLWEDTVRLIEAHERMTRARFEAGAVLKSDLLSVGVKLSEARENLILATSESRIARVALGTAMGIDWREVELPDRSLELPSYDGDEEAVAAAARAVHPAIAALEAAARAAAHSERAAGRGNWPAVSGEVYGIWHGEDEAPGLQRDFYVAAVVLDFPFFDRGRARAARGEASARRLEADAARREAADSLELAARTAHWQARDAVARVGIDERAVEAASEAMRIIEERYRAGMAKIVDLIESERALTEARVRALAARAQAWTALAAVERVAGEGVGQ